MMKTEKAILMNFAPLNAAVAALVAYEAAEAALVAARSTVVAAYASYDAARAAAPASTRTDAGVELALCCASEGWALPPCWR